MFDKLLNDWSFQALCLLIQIVVACKIIIAVAKPYEEAFPCVAISLLISCAWFCGCMKGPDK